MLERYTLKLKDFHANVAESYTSWRDDPDFSDISLLTSDEKVFKGHRIVLSSVSPFFKNILKKMKTSEPMIFLKGVHSRDILPILGFIYTGEAKVLHEDLAKFMSVAKDLDIRGLSSKTNELALHNSSQVLVEEVLYVQKQRVNNRCCNETLDNFRHYFAEKVELKLDNIVEEKEEEYNNAVKPRDFLASTYVGDDADDLSLQMRPDDVFSPVLQKLDSVKATVDENYGEKSEGEKAIAANKEDQVNARDDSKNIGRKRSTSRGSQPRYINTSLLSSLSVPMLDANSIREYMDSNFWQLRPTAEEK